MKEPNIEQEQIIINNGLIPKNWDVAIDKGDTIEVVSKRSFQRRKLSKEKIKDRPLTLAEIREIEKRNAEDRGIERNSRIMTACKKKCFRCGREYPIETELCYCNICGGFLYMQQELIIPKKRRESD